MTDKSIPDIRQATASDAALMAELGARTFSETFAADNTPEDMAAYLAASFSPEQQAAELADPARDFSHRRNRQNCSRLRHAPCRRATAPGQS